MLPRCQRLFETFFKNIGSAFLLAAGRGINQGEVPGNARRSLRALARSRRSRSAVQKKKAAAEQRPTTASSPFRTYLIYKVKDTGGNRRVTRSDGHGDRHHDGRRHNRRQRRCLHHSRCRRRRHCHCRSRPGRNRHRSHSPGHSCRICRRH